MPATIITTAPTPAQFTELLTILYSRHVFLEFRTPVLKKYPELKTDYHQKIKEPMDLGTLLYQSLLLQSEGGEQGIKEGGEGILTLPILRKGLKLIISNALIFNSDFPLIQAIANHLLRMSKGLFEEFFKLPFQLKKTEAEEEEEDEDKDKEEAILLERSRRYQLIGNSSLNRREYQKFLEILNKLIHENGNNKLVKGLFQRMNDQLTRQLSIIENWKNGLRKDALPSSSPISSTSSSSLTTITPSDRYPAYTFKEIIQSLIEPSSAPSSSSSSTSTSVSSLTTKIPLIDHFYPKDTFIQKKFLPFLEKLDAQLGILLVEIEERLLRGVSFSSYWLIPHEKCIWSPLPKDRQNRSPWWPGMIIISHANTFPMNIQVMERNIERIPKDMVKELVKCKPRIPTIPASQQQQQSTTLTALAENIATAMPKVPLLPQTTAPATEGEKDDETVSTHENNSASTTNNGKTPIVPKTTITSINCPEGYLVVEYFGTHELAWVKADLAAPMNIDGTIPKFSKVCSKDVFEEAEECRAIIQRYYTSYGEYSYDGEDLIEIPTKEDLKESIDLSNVDFNAAQSTIKKEVKEAKEPKPNSSNGSSNKKASNSNSNHSKPTSNQEEETDSLKTGDSSKKNPPKKRKFLSSTVVNDLNPVMSPNPKKTSQSHSAFSSPAVILEKEFERNADYFQDEESQNYFNQPEQIEEEEHDSDSEANEDERRQSKRLSGAFKSVKTFQIYDKNRQNLTNVNTPSKFQSKDLTSRIPQFEKAILGNKFIVSKCPLAVPIDFTDLPNNAIIAGFHSRNGINVRRNAIMRTRGYVHWLNKTKPIQYLSSTGEGTEDDGKGGSSSGKGRSSSSHAHSWTFYQRPIAKLSRQALDKIPVHEFFDKTYGTLIETGCTRYFAGKGLIYSRVVDFNHPIFFREDKDPKIRIQKLQQELQDINKLTEKYLKLAQGIEEDEEEEKQEEVEEEPAEEAEPMEEVEPAEAEDSEEEGGEESEGEEMEVEEDS